MLSRGLAAVPATARGRLKESVPLYPQRSGPRSKVRVAALPQSEAIVCLTAVPTFSDEIVISR
jgi:hypothetical protein